MLGVILFQSVYGDRHLLLLRGCKKAGNYILCTSGVYRFNSASNSWEASSCIPSARGAAAAVNVGDDRIVVIEGVNDKNQKQILYWSCELAI